MGKRVGVYSMINVQLRGRASFLSLAGLSARNSWWPILACVLCLAATPAAAEGDDGAAEAGDGGVELRPYGPAGSPLPARATLVTAQQFQDLLAQGALHVTTLHSWERQSDQTKVDNQLHEEVVKRYLRQHPELTNLARLVANDPRPGDGVVARRDGTWSVQVPALNRPVVTLGRTDKLAAVYHSIVFSQDRAANLRLYTQLYASLPFRYLELVKVKPIAPNRLEGASLAVIQTALGSLGADVSAIVARVDPAVALELFGCDGELGATDYSSVFGDRTGNLPGCDPSSSGIYANFDFDNKTYNTCIKDQGRRGTCQTFAVTSATELQVARARGVRVNLSEQDLWEHYRLLWQPDVQHEGGSVSELANHVVAHQYSQPYERSWNYNPAPNEVLVNNSYVHVCDTYPASEPCSDSSVEAPLFCWGSGPLLYCGFLDAGIAAGPYRTTAVNALWDPANTERSTELLVLALAFGNGVVLGFSETPAFMSPSSSGFVTSDAADLAAPSPGQHVVHLIGFIGNTELHQRLPDAPSGAGGGYFIAKNSWSTCFGDGGYIYLPWDYVKGQALEVVAISGVN
jgi:hypothetical protein